MWVSCSFLRRRVCEKVVGLRGKVDGLTRKPRRAIKERVPPRQMGSIAMSKGPCLEPISALIETKRVAVSANQRK